MAARTGLFVAPLPGATPAGTSPTDGRLVLGAAFGTGGGCLSGGALTASSTAMQVNVAAAVWRIPDPTNNAGVYLSPADADVFTFSAGPASGSRIDVLYVRQNNYEAGDANSRLIYGVAAGTAAASPTAPAIPAGALKVGQLTVPTGASNAGACTLVATYAGASVLRPQLAVNTETQLPAAGDYVGQLAYVASATIAGTTLPLVERWTGSVWKRWSSDWAGYTPTISNVTNTGTSVQFRFTDGQLLVRGYFFLNGGAAVNGQIKMSLPVARDTTGLGLPTGNCFAVKNAGSAYPLGIDYDGVGTVKFNVLTGNPVVYQSTSSTAPFTWAQSDTVTFSITVPDLA